MNDDSTKFIKIAHSQRHILQVTRKKEIAHKIWGDSEENAVENITG